MGRSQWRKDEGMHVLRRGRQRQRPRDGEGMEPQGPLGSQGSCTWVCDEHFPRLSQTLRFHSSFCMALTSHQSWDWGFSPHFPHLEKLEFKKQVMTCAVSHSERLS